MYICKMCTWLDNWTMQQRIILPPYVNENISKPDCTLICDGNALRHTQSG